jgi:hypothetical protein
MREHGFALPAILCDWPGIVGAATARDSSPERLSRDGTLTVRVAGPIATVLQHQEPDILSRIATYFGHRAVLRLRFVRGPLPQPSRRAMPSQRILDADEELALDRLAHRIADPALRAALLRLGRAVVAASPRPA